MSLRQPILQLTSLAQSANKQMTQCTSLITFVWKLSWDQKEGEQNTLNS